MKVCATTRCRHRAFEALGLARGVGCNTVSKDSEGSRGRSDPPGRGGIGNGVLNRRPPMASFIPDTARNDPAFLQDGQHGGSEDASCGVGGCGDAHFQSLRCAGDPGSAPRSRGRTEGLQRGGPQQLAGLHQRSFELERQNLRRVGALDWRRRLPVGLPLRDAEEWPWIHLGRVGGPRRRSPGVDSNDELRLVVERKRPRVSQTVLSGG